MSPRKLGPDASTWRWGRLHVAKFDHALMPLADKATAAQLSVGPLAYGGAANVPRAATYRRSDYQLTAGASFRMVLDVGNWDASRTINTPGQSGDPFSGHYRDLAPLWATGPICAAALQPPGGRSRDRGSDHADAEVSALVAFA